MTGRDVIQNERTIAIVVQFHTDFVKKMSMLALER